MKTTLPEGQVREASWGVDFTPSMYCRQNYMYIQCMGCYDTYSNYGTFHRKNLDSFLVLHVLEGSGALEYREEKSELNAGDMVIIDCRKEHSYYCTPESWKIQWMHFNGSCISGYLAEITEKSCPLHSEKLAKKFTSMIGAAKSGADKIEYTGIDDLNRSTAIIQFCMEFLHEIRTTQDCTGKELSPVVKKAIELFEERFQEKLSLETVCAGLGVSKFHFSRLFKEQTGCSPYEYLINLRISFSKNLLRSTSCDIAEISDRAGFDNSSYFISIFHKREGVTPLKYRKMFTA